MGIAAARDPITAAGPPPVAAAASTGHVYPSMCAPGRAWWAIGLLGFLYILSLVDRYILVLLVAPLKAELGVSDTQVGLLFGTVFALVYGLVGLPIGRIVDNGNRKLVILAGLIVWSLSTLLSAFATSYWMLLVLRLGLALGEAALLPAAYSMIGDIFEPRRRTLAASIFSALGLAGSGASFIISAMIIAFVDDLHATGLVPQSISDWRMVLACVSLPGFLAAPLLYFTVREPARVAREGSAAAAADSASLRVLLAHLASHVQLYAAVFSGALIATVGYAFTAWMPELLRRDFGWSTAQSGPVVGTMMMIAMLSAALVGPQIAEAMRRRGRDDGLYWVMLVGLVVGVAASALAPLQSGPWGFVICYGIAAFFTGLVKSTSLVSIQIVTPSRMRATVVAIFLIIASLFGFGIGPALTAALSARVFDGEQDLAPALTTMSLLIGVPVTLLFLWAGRGLIDRMRHLED